MGARGRIQGRRARFKGKARLLASWWEKAESSLRKGKGLKSKKKNRELDKGSLYLGLFLLFLLASGHA